MASDFLFESYVQPVIQNGWFNPVNSITYGLILIIGVVLVYKLLQKLKIEPDWKFLLAIIPFVIWAPITRTIRDYVYRNLPSTITSTQQFQTDLGYNIGVVYSNTQAHVSQSLPSGISNLYSGIVSWFVTPGSYLITTVIALGVFLLCVGIQRKFKLEYWKPMFVLGLIGLVVSMFALPVTSLEPLGFLLMLFLPTAAILLAITFALTKTNFRLKNVVKFSSTGIVIAHLLDSAATSTALHMYGFREQHPVIRFLYESFGTIYGSMAFFLVKIVVVFAVLWAFDQYIEDKRLRNFLKIVVVILGLAPGVRDAITLLLGIA
ncbi:MAG TPA: DUF63 family protein [archaeon]|nr:DUF63 family protein [archaeon]